MGGNAGSAMGFGGFGGVGAFNPVMEMGQIGVGNLNGFGGANFGVSSGPMFQPNMNIGNEPLG